MASSLNGPNITGSLTPGSVFVQKATIEKCTNTVRWIAFTNLVMVDQLETPAISFGPLEHSLGLLLRIAQLTVSERTFAELNRRDVPIGEFTILFVIDLNPGIRQGALADRLKIKWSNMTKLVRALEARGMVVRQVPPHDRRAITLRVTEAGHAHVESHRGRVLDAIERSVPTLDEQEKHVLLGLLRKVAGWPPS